jgi:Sugar-transfer associated ATP-grasp
MVTRIIRSETHTPLVVPDRAPLDHASGHSADPVPGWRDVLRADIGQLRRDFRTPRGQASRAFDVLSKLLDEKRGSYQMRIVYFPPLPLLWSLLPGDGSTASFLHKFYCRGVWRERGLWARLRLLAAFALWPLVVSGMIVWSSGLNGAAIKRRVGKSVGRQMVEQLQLAAAHAVLPPWYYIFELFEDHKRTRVHEYLHRFETKGGIHRFLKRSPKGARTPLRDKLLFAAWCRSHGLDNVAIVLAADHGEFLPEFLARPDAEPALPEADLFVKPFAGRGGAGAERWRFDGPGQYVDDGGTVLTNVELLAHFRRQSRSGGCIVQPRLRNHPAIADLSNGALSTVRLVTIVNERDEFEPSHAVLRMAVGANTVVDNFHAGGVAAAVDMRTGTLGRATDVGLRPEIGWRDRHPDTDAPITGRVLPFWQETQELAVRAHAAFADRLLIGWDIAITKDGPVLIEGNSGPDLDIIQRVYGEPLGNARFGALIAMHLRRATGLSDAPIANQPNGLDAEIGRASASPKGAPS